MAVTRWSLPIVLGAFASVAFLPVQVAKGQDGAGVFDRTAYILPGTETSDDPRRIPVAPGTHTPDGRILITDARLFDSTGSSARKADILIDGKTIAAIESSIPPPDGVRLIDARGRTVMPGLIDLHVHLTYVERFGDPRELTDENQSDAALRGITRLRAYVENGITTVRDTSSDGMAPFRLKDWVAEGRIPGPRVFASGQLITGKGGHGTEGFGARTAPEYAESALREAAGSDDWIAAVREQFKNGADFIKLASHYSPEEVRAAIEEAHRLGLKVTVDSETVFTAMAVEAGVDSIEHPLPRSDETISRMVDLGVDAVPTFVPYQLIIGMAGGYYGSTSRRFTLTEDIMFEQGQKMRDAGVRLGVGTDLILDWYQFLPGPYIRELQNFETLGYTPAEAVIAATSTNAAITGMDDKLGTIEVGKLADVIIVSGRPDEDVTDLANVDTVIIGGRIVVLDNQVVLPGPHIPKSLPDSTE